MAHDAAQRDRRAPAAIPVLALLLSAVLAIPAARAETTQVGNASWYGSRFQGRPTASGETFDMNQLTAAHPTLPFGTRVRVTNLANGKSTVVTINDRGPFVANRIIDLSRAAAMAIGMAGTGVAEVRLQVLNPVPGVTAVAAEHPSGSATQGGVVEKLRTAQPVDSAAGAGSEASPLTAASVAAPPPSAPQTPAVTAVSAADPAQVPSVSPLAAAAAAQGSSVTPAPAAAVPQQPQAVIVQVGAFRILRNAIHVASLLQSRGLRPIYERYGDLTRVVLPSVVPADVPALRTELSQLGFQSILIRHD